MDVRRNLKRLMEDFGEDGGKGNASWGLEETGQGGNVEPTQSFYIFVVSWNCLKPLINLFDWKLWLLQKITENCYLTCITIFVIVWEIFFHNKSGFLSKLCFRTILIILFILKWVVSFLVIRRVCSKRKGWINLQSVLWASCSCHVKCSHLASKSLWRRACIKYS